ncbi:hypothetical protein FAIPA1_350013 [Frankia sp. AiPs1]
MQSPSTSKASTTGSDFLSTLGYHTPEHVERLYLTDQTSIAEAA